MPICRTCRRGPPEVRFHKGNISRCVDCRRMADNIKYHSDSEYAERSKDYQRRYQSENKEAIAIQRRKRRKRKITERQDAIRAIKAARGCEQCGIKDYRCLEFDHIDPAQKKFTISQAVSALHIPFDRVLEEVDKCRVLCSNCHAIKHYPT